MPNSHKLCITYFSRGKKKLFQGPHPPAHPLVTGLTGCLDMYECMRRRIVKSGKLDCSRIYLINPATYQIQHKLGQSKGS